MIWLRNKIREDQNIKRILEDMIASEAKDKEEQAEVEKEEQAEAIMEADQEVVTVVAAEPAEAKPAAAPPPMGAEEDEIEESKVEEQEESKAVDTEPELSEADKASLAWL